ncbi:MAG: HAD-IA family hydrolase [Lactimicrobium sp.]|jgi:phosphoglycolate phosphatase|uniref:HAD-IA family hydrolase n=1 Tax=Lactimicrobium sp. TaxID=2563780 RepID=UPI002F35CFBE
MVKYDTVLFDLDGTLTNSAPGITACVQKALAHFGIHYEQKDLTVFVGPPLREMFPRFGVKEDDVEEAVAVFRQNYNAFGKFDNAPYDGIAPLLSSLCAAGIQLGVATSKPQDLAVEILNRFDLAKYFVLIAGASLDGSRDSKLSVLQYALASMKYHRCVLVGDTAYDAVGARDFGMDAIGVSWGFGDLDAMKQAGMNIIVDTPVQLEKILLAGYTENR